MELSTEQADIEYPPLPNPQDITQEMWKQLCQINNKLERLNKQGDELKSELHGEDGIYTKLDHLSNVESNVTDLKEENKDIKIELQILKAVVTKQGAMIDELKKKVVDLTDRSMKNNLLCHNLPEQDQENIEQRIQDVLRQKLGLTNRHVIIERIHRIGFKSPNGCRPIVMKLNNYKDVEAILQLGKDKLPKGKDLIRFTPQTPTEIHETRKNLYSVIDAVKATSPEAKFNIKKDKLIINSEVYRTPLPTPTPTDVLNIPTEEKIALAHNVPVYEGECVRKQGSRFVACVTPIKSFDDARAAYKRILLNDSYMTATHNVACAILYNPFTGKCDTHHADDSEWGAGKFITQHLIHCNARNIAVFLSRKYGGKHLGKDRFDCMKDAVNSALEAYKNKEG